MKEKLSSIDISALIKNLQIFIGMRLNNIYDGNNYRTYHFKFADTNIKKFMFVEAANKIYSYSNDFELSRQMPSSFCSKLRKHLKNKRLNQLYQLNSDRVIILKFGNEEYTNYLIIELYSSGNIIITDNEFNIIHMLRKHIYDENNKTSYPINNTDKILDIDNEMIIKCFNNEYNINLEQSIKNNKYLKNLPPVIVKHILLDYSFDKFIDYNDFIIYIKSLISRLDNLTSGYIIKKNNKYYEYTPYLFKQYYNLEYVEYETLDKAIGQYYSHTIDLKKNSSNSKKETIKKKKNKHERKGDHLQNQVNKLEKQADTHLYKAEYIQENIKLIDTLIKKFNYYFQNKYKDQEIIDDLNPLKISNIDFKDKKFNLDNIEIYFNQSAYDNISRYHTKKKHHKNKLAKAQIIHQSEQSKKEKNQIKDEKNNNIKQLISKITRKTYWFETYNWFKSSDGYLVICGKSAEQNEALVKKYLDKNDIYVHADYHGSGSCVIKNHNNLNIPISTLEQAGNFVLCFSKAWQSNITDKAYYVNADQVSKTAPSGEYLSTGSMMVRGKKNYLSYVRLELSIAVVFKIETSDQSETNYNFKINLKPEDIVKEALYMVAPSRVLQQATYKSKILPGTAKRGKTLRAIYDSYKTNKYICNEEYFIKSLKVTDLDILLPFKIKKT